MAKQEDSDIDLEDSSGEVYCSVCEYYNERFEEQVRWYDKKSVLNKRLYHGFQILVLGLTAAIPSGASLLPTKQDIVFFITVVATVLLIAQGILSLYRFHEKWMNYRSTTEALRREGQLFKQNAGDYTDHETPETLFVERVEELVSQEHRIWRVISRKAKGN